MTRPPCVRLCPAYPGNPRKRIEGESPPQGKGHTVFAVGRHEQKSRIPWRRMTEFMPARAWMIHDPVNHRHIMLGRDIEEILLSQPAMIELRVEAEDADGVLQALQQLRRLARFLEFHDLVRHPQPGEKLAHVLHVNAIMLVRRAAEKERAPAPCFGV